MKINLNKIEWDDHGELKMPRIKKKKKLPKHKEPKDPEKRS